MKTHPISHRPLRGSPENLTSGSEHPLLPKVAAELGIRLPIVQDAATRLIERVALTSRVIIVEGISGSGKDAFQTLLQKKLGGRNVYDYSEGEVLHSWKQLQIEGSSKLRVKFMKLFVNYMKHAISEDGNAVFLLNRFHLSAYILTVVQQPNLEAEYEEIIKILKTLPVHVFILQLDRGEIEERSSHPERSAAWRKFQEAIVKQDGFHGRFQRYLWQQKTILEKAKTQQIPYSIIKVPCEAEAETGEVRIPRAPTVVRSGARLTIGNPPSSRRKLPLPPSFYKA